MKFINREMQESDIPLITNYWASLTEEDIKRMFINSKKLLPPNEFGERLKKLIALPVCEREVDPLIWEVDTGHCRQKVVGLTNLNNIERGKQASIHLHIFNPNDRRRGYGRQLFVLSVEKYLKRHQLKNVVCEPALNNPHPNGLMRALEIPIVRSYLNTNPAVICFEHAVNRYEIDQQLVERIKSRSQVTDQITNSQSTFPTTTPLI